jgi:hypothetical protein
VDGHAGPHGHHGPFRIKAFNFPNGPGRLHISGRFEYGHSTTSVLLLSCRKHAPEHSLAKSYGCYMIKQIQNCRRGLAGPAGLAGLVGFAAAVTAPAVAVGAPALAVAASAKTFNAPGRVRQRI